MTDAVHARRQFGDGPLSQVTSLVYTLLVVEGLFVLTTAPGLVVLVLLDRHPGNLPLMALCAVPLAPAACASLYALQFRRDPTDLRPARLFWRGYRVNAVASLRIWVPLLAMLTVISINLAYLDVAGVPSWWVVPTVLIGAGATLWGVNALVIVALFCFRTRDVARLAAYFLVHRPRAALGTACLLFVMAAVTVLLSEAVLTLGASLLAAVLLQTQRPMITEIERDFIA